MTHQSPRSKFPSPWDDKIILTALAVAQAISLAYTGGVSDSLHPAALTTLSITRASLMGLAISFGMAKTIQRIPTVKGKRAIIAWVTVGALFVISPAIVAAAFLAPEWAYHVLAVIGCDLAAVAVAIGAKALADETAKVATVIEKPAKQPAKPAEPVAKYRCSCGWDSDDQHAWAGHKRKNPLHTRIIDK